MVREPEVEAVWPACHQHDPHLQARLAPRAACRDAAPFCPRADGSCWCRRAMRRIDRGLPPRRHAGSATGAIQRRDRFQQGGRRSLLAVSRRHATLLLRTHRLRLSEAGTASRPAPQRLGHAHTRAEALDERALLPPFIRARVRASTERLSPHGTLGLAPTQRVSVTHAARIFRPNGLRLASGYVFTVHLTFGSCRSLVHVLRTRRAVAQHWDLGRRSTGAGPVRILAHSHSQSKEHYDAFI